MPVTLIVGGHGKVALHLTRQLVAEKSPAHTVHSIIRNAAQIPELEKLGAFPIVQSIEEATVPELLTTLSRIKPDIVVWAAGAGYGSAPSRIEAVDRDGAIKIMDALAISARAGDTGKRLVSISALDLRDREGRPVPSWYDADDRAQSGRLWAAIGLFLKAKFEADREMRVGNERRGLDYTMVRPGGLSDEPGEGLVGAGKVHLGRVVRREDVARVLMECIKNDDTIGLAFDIVGGEDIISEAVKEVGKGKIDTFEGYY